MTKIHDKVQEFIKSMQNDNFTEEEMLEVSKILYTATTCEVLNKAREDALVTKYDEKKQHSAL